jgi:hypothetical protein
VARGLMLCKDDAAPICNKGAPGRAVCEVRWLWILPRAPYVCRPRVPVHTWATFLRLEGVKGHRTFYRRFSVAWVPGENVLPG